MTRTLDSHGGGKGQASDGGPHELLPWHIVGVLSDEESRQVRRHIADCGDCAREAGVLEVMLRVARTEGEDLFAGHATPGQVISYARNEPGPPLPPDVNSHLETCAACRDEIECVRKAEQVTEDARSAGWAPPGPIPAGLRRPYLYPAAALLLAACVIVGVLLWPPGTGSPPEHPGSAWLPALLVDSATRSADATEIGLPAAAPGFILLLVVDALPEDLPVQVEVHDAHSDLISTQTVPGPLLRDAFVTLYCRREQFPAGTYSATVSSLRTEGPPQRYKFTVTAVD